jgi:hypothetical protein
MSLLDEIISGAVDDKTNVSVVLRKCLLLAHQLRNEKLKIWAERELNGYTDVDALPPYRVVGVQATGTFSGPMGTIIRNQPLPASILDEEYRHWATTAYLMQPIASFDIGKDAEGKPNGGHYTWPADLTAMYANKFMRGYNLVRASIQVSGTAFVGVLDNVRTRILQLALELKDQLGEDIADMTKLVATKVDRSVINNIYGGNVVIAENAEHFAQIGAISLQEGDFGQLERALKELGLDEKAISSLKKAMDQDSKSDGGKPTLGQRTKKWLKDSASYASKEGLKVGIDAAKKYAAKWLLQHYGLDI